MSQGDGTQSSRKGRQAVDVATQPDAEVVPKAERRKFSADYKLRILAEAKWRTQRKRGALQALEPQKRGRKVDAQAETIIEVQKSSLGCSA